VYRYMHSGASGAEATAAKPDSHAPAASTSEALSAEAKSLSSASASATDTQGSTVQRPSGASPAMSHLYGHIPSEFENTLEAYHYQMSICMKNQDYNGVEEVYKKVISLGLTPTLRTFTALLTARIQARKLDEALKVFDLARSFGLSPDAAMYNRLLVHYGNKHAAQAALETLQEMREKGVTPDSHSLQYVISTLVSRGRIDAARQTFDQETGPGGLIPTPECFIQIVRGYVQADRISDALSFMKARQITMAPALMVRCANLVIKALLQKGEFNKAFVLVESIQSLGSELDHVTCNLILHAAVKAGDMKTARELFAKMRALAGKPPLPVGNEGSHESTHMASEQCTQPSQPQITDSASLTKEERHNRLQTVNAFSYNIMIEGHLAEGEYEEVFALLREMAEQRMGLGTVTFNLLLDHFARKKKWDVMETLRKRMIDLNVPADTVTFNIFMAAAATRRDTKAIETLLSLMKEHKLKRTTYTYTSAMRGFCACGDMARASSLLSEMEADGIEPNVVSYTVLIAGYGRTGQIAAATDIFELMKAKGVTPNRVSYSIFINGCLSSRAWEKAEELVREMCQVGFRPDPSVYGKLISGLRLNGEVEKAQRVQDFVVELTSQDKLVKGRGYDRLDKHGKPQLKKLKGGRALKRLADVVTQTGAQ